jgi:hypothetical protein
MNPGYGVGYTVNSGVMLGAGECGGVLLDADDMVPFLGEGEGDGVAAGAGEQVNDGVFARGRVVVGANVFGYFAGGEVSTRVVEIKERGKVRGYWFGRDAEPGVVCEADVVVVEVEDGVTLLPVSGRVSLGISNEMNCRYGRTYFLRSGGTSLMSS